MEQFFADNEMILVPVVSILGLLFIWHFFNAVHQGSKRR